MTTTQILSADLLDLIFDDRNKSYGAYELRKTYSSRIRNALLITGCLVSLILAGIYMGSSAKKEAIALIKEDTYKLTSVVTEKPTEKQVIKEQKKQVKKDPVRTEQFNSFKIVPNDVPVDKIPTHDELDIAAIGNDKKEGTEPEGVPALDEKIGGEEGIIEKPKPGNQILDIVHVQAKYAGNWEKFLLRHLNAEVPIDNGAPAGKYTVIIQFVVDLDGSVSDIKPLTSHGYGLEEEAIRVLKKANKWEPGIQNGFAVKSYRRQPITFVVESY